MSPRLHPLLRLVICLFGIGALYIIVGGVIVGALSTASRITGQPIDPAGFFARNQILVTVMFYPPLLLWLWFCRRAVDSRSFVSLGLHANGSGRSFSSGAACGALAITLLFAILLLTGNARINGPSPEAFEAGTIAAASILCFYVLLFLAVGFMEEVAFRGYALHNLAAWLDTRSAIILQAIVFALVHLSNVAMKPQTPGGSGAAVQATRTLYESLWDTKLAMLNIALIGLFFALCYLKTGSLWFPIGFHAAWNFFLGCVWSLPVSGITVFRALDISVSQNALLTGGEFGAEGSILLTPLLLVLLWAVWQEGDHAQARNDLKETRDEGAPKPILPLTPPPAAVTAPAVEEQYEPSRFKTSMRPMTRAGTPVNAEANQAQAGNSFTRDVTATIAATTGETETRTVSQTPLEALNSFHVDVTESSRGSDITPAAEIKNRVSTEYRPPSHTEAQKTVEASQGTDQQQEETVIPQVQGPGAMPSNAVDAASTAPVGTAAPVAKKTKPRW